MRRLLAVRPSARVRQRSCRAALAVLLGLFGFLGSAAPAVAGDGRASVESGTRHLQSSAADARPSKQDSPQRRSQCDPGESSRHHLDERRIIHGPGKLNHATARRLAADPLMSVNPGEFSLVAPLVASTDEAGPVNSPVQRRSHRTFDGRAPPVH